MTWTEYFEVLRSLYPHFRLFEVPRSIGHAGAFLLEPLLSRPANPTLYTKDTVVGFNLEVPVAPGLVWDDLGIEPLYPNVDEGIAATLDGYVHFQWRNPLVDRRRT